MNVMNVGNPLATNHHSRYITGLTQERSLVNVMNVGKFFTVNQTSLNIIDHTQGRSPMNVTHVRKPFLRSQTLLYISEHTQEKNLMTEVNIRNVERQFSTYSISENSHYGESSVDILNVLITFIHTTGHILLQSNDIGPISRLQQVQGSLVKR